MHDISARTSINHSSFAPGLMTINLDDDSDILVPLVLMTSSWGSGRTTQEGRNYSFLAYKMRIEALLHGDIPLG